MPKRSRSGVVKRPARVVAPLRVDCLRGSLIERAGPVADYEIKLKILHRRIEDFLDSGVQPVNFVDEEDIALVKRSELGGKIAGLGNDRPRSRMECDAEFARDDLRQGRLSKPWRANK